VPDPIDLPDLSRLGEEFGLLLHRRRLDRNLSGAQLANSVDMDAEVLRMFEAGEALPAAATLAALIRELGMHEPAGDDGMAAIRDRIVTLGLNLEQIIADREAVFASTSDPSAVAGYDHTADMLYDLAGRAMAASGNGTPDAYRHTVERVERATFLLGEVAGMLNDATKGLR
jgi:transcriptional regulator with XRE-family HTH domain